MCRCAGTSSSPSRSMPLSGVIAHVAWQRQCSVRPTDASSVTASVQAIERDRWFLSLTSLRRTRLCELAVVAPRAGSGCQHHSCDLHRCTTSQRPLRAHQPIACVCVDLCERYWAASSSSSSSSSSMSTCLNGSGCGCFGCVGVGMRPSLLSAPLRLPSASSSGSSRS